MVKDNTKKIEGAGHGTTYLFSYYSSKVGDQMPMPEKARKELIKFNQQQEVDRMRFDATVINPIIQSWEDRNINNANTKLSKEKPLRGKRPLPRIPNMYTDNKVKKRIKKARKNK